VYASDIVPDEPSFPVLRLQGVAPGDVFVEQQPNVDPGGVPGTNVTPPTPPAESVRVAPPPDASLGGFSVYLADATSGRRVSSLTTLPASEQSCTPFSGTPNALCSNKVFINPNPCPTGFICSSPSGAPGPVCVPLLLTLGGEWPVAGTPANLEVVVAPPSGAPIPYLSDPVTTALATEPFPSLPPPVTVSGTVVGPDLVPVAASLVIDSTPFNVGSGTGGIRTTNPTDRSRRSMHYSTSAQTDASGAYSVTLPPGTYDAYVVPAPGSNLGATSVTIDVSPPLASEPPIATGRDVMLAAPGTLTGIARVADGRALEGATVEAVPAASLAPTVDPRRWPRAGRARTDATGTFTMALDPGLYDVIVEPAGGTGLPWVTLSGQQVTAGQATTLQQGKPVLVPAPQVFDLVLHDAGDNAIVHAVVRAYATAAGSTNPTAGAPAPVIEIGSWLTDTTGHFTMLVAPPK
jgi:hypothetical protein